MVEGKKEISYNAFNRLAISEKIISRIDIKGRSDIGAIYTQFSSCQF